MSQVVQLHATCVSVDGKGVLLLGASGSGKSDVALRLIDAGATLVGDDQIQIHKERVLLASPCERLQGMIEARGVGILKLPYAENVSVALAVQLVAREDVERLPDPQFFDCLGLQVPLLSLNAFDASTIAKIHLFLRTQR